ncbi:hypothetical protein [Runella aurantiaca]|uniref:Uncharacterized protein n=1 Tax=Runella aurantiaca TaxID=2282308 RepID=A0A369I3U0_9BACT|nr:hypothetical protein [Runella aurantiaca]RDB03570.1 hypothetical protein DVG78_22960 [Runella aurantiaca]
MTQVTLKIDDAFIESLGKEQIEKLLQEWLMQYKKRLELQEAADELSSIDLVNDPQWQTARFLAWETYKHNFEDLAL